MIEKQKPLLQTEETEKVSKKPLSNEELSSLIKASNNKKFNEAELKVKKNENESFKKITLHDIAKQINQQNKEKVPNGLLFKKQTCKDIIDTISWFEDKKLWNKFNPEILNEYSQNFSIENFISKFDFSINKAWEIFKRKL